MATAYKGKTRWGDDPILTIEDGKAYAGKKNWGEDPILSFEDDKIYSGRKHWGADPVATDVRDDPGDHYRFRQSEAGRAVG